MNIIFVIHVYLLHCIERIFNNLPAVSLAYGMNYSFNRYYHKEIKWFSDLFDSFFQLF